MDALQPGVGLLPPSRLPLEQGRPRLRHLESAAEQQPPKQPQRRHREPGQSVSQSVSECLTVKSKLAVDKLYYVSDTSGCSLNGG